MDDLYCKQLVPLTHIDELEVHLTWSGLTAGFELYCERIGNTLTSLDITMLDNYSWSSILTIGCACPHLTKLHLTLWREDMADVAVLNLPHIKDRNVFSNVEDLKVKCEMYVEFLPEEVFEVFLHQCSRLRIVQYIAPIDWVIHQDLIDLFSTNPLPFLEMLVLTNTSHQPMDLGLASVMLCLSQCPRLTVLGDLRTWRKIDYYDPESDFYFKSESMFC